MAARHTACSLGGARAAVVAYFILLGTAMATWSSRLPAIKHQLHLSDRALGLALFAVPCGSGLVFPLAGRVADRFCAAALLRVAGPLTAVSLIGPGVARGFGWLIAALFSYGASAGLLDVAMNAAGTRLEWAYGRPIMSSLHASYSLAGLFGAGLGGLFAAADVGPLPTFTTAAVPLTILGIAASRWVITPGADVPGPASAAPAVAHPAVPHAIPTDATAMHAAAARSAAGRLAGDALAARFGPAPLVRCSGLVAAAGLGGGLLAGNPVCGVAGFALLGAGLAAIFPQLVAAAGRLDPAHAGRSIARIAGAGYTGLLGGPVVIGFAAGGVGLTAALLIPAGLALVVAAFAGVLRAGAAARSC